MSASSLVQKLSSITKTYKFVAGTGENIIWSLERLYISEQFGIKTALCCAGCTLAPVVYTKYDISILLLYIYIYI
jgi:hypothetical protein